MECNHAESMYGRCAACGMTWKEQAVAQAHPLGTMASTIVYGIGGRAENVSGTVVDHKRGFVHIKTAAHGTLAVPLSKIAVESQP